MFNFSAHLQDHSILRSLPSESTNLTEEERGVLKQAGGFSLKKQNKTEEDSWDKTHLRQNTKQSNLSANPSPQTF